MDSALVVLAQQGGSGMTSLIPLLLIIVVFYFLIIRPQQARARQQRELVSSIAPGDRVVTIGGLHGTILSVDDDSMRLEAAPNVVLTFTKQAVARRLLDADAGAGEDLEQAGND
jgi:preprotein translocase subunit YajC